jgi:putative flippase GtrA
VSEIYPDKGPSQSRDATATARERPLLKALLNEKLGAGQRQFVKFLFVGVLNTAFGYGVFSVLVLLKLDAGISLFVSTAMGILFNYLTTGRLVFAARGLRRLPYFIAVYGLTFLFNLWSLRFLLSRGLSPFLAQAILLPLMVAMSFTLNKIFVFRNVKAP